MTTEQMVSQMVANIRAELARAHVTQGAAADVIGVSGPQFSARMSGRMDFRVHEVFALAGWLGVPVSRFLPDSSIDLTMTEGGTRVGTASVATLPWIDSNDQPAGYLPVAADFYAKNPKAGINLPPLPTDTPASKAA